MGDSLKEKMDNGEEERMLNGDAHHHDTNDGKLSMFHNDDLCFMCSDSASELFAASGRMVWFSCCQKVVCEDCVVSYFREEQHGLDGHYQPTLTYKYSCPSQNQLHLSPEPIHLAPMTSLLQIAGGAVASLSASIKTLSVRVTKQGMPPHTASHILSHRLALTHACCSLLADRQLDASRVVATLQVTELAAQRISNDALRAEGKYYTHCYCCTDCVFCQLLI